MYSADRGETKAQTNVETRVSVIMYLTTRLAHAKRIYSVLSFQQCFLVSIIRLQEKAQVISGDEVPRCRSICCLFFIFYCSTCQIASQCFHILKLVTLKLLKPAVQNGLDVTACRLRLKFIIIIIIINEAQFHLWNVGVATSTALCMHRCHFRHASADYASEGRQAEMIPTHADTSWCCRTSRTAAFS